MLAPRYLKNNRPNSASRRSSEDSKRECTHRAWHSALSTGHGRDASSSYIFLRSEDSHESFSKFSSRECLRSGWSNCQAIETPTNEGEESEEKKEGMKRTKRRKQETHKERNESERERERESHTNGETRLLAFARCAATKTRTLCNRRGGPPPGPIALVYRHRTLYSLFSVYVYPFLCTHLFQTCSNFVLVLIN